MQAKIELHHTGRLAHALKKQSRSMLVPVTGYKS